VIALARDEQLLPNIHLIGFGQAIRERDDRLLDPCAIGDPAKSFTLFDGVFGVSRGVASGYDQRRGEQYEKPRGSRPLTTEPLE